MSMGSQIVVINALLKTSKACDDYNNYEHLPLFNRFLLVNQISSDKTDNEWDNEGDNLLNECLGLSKYYCTANENEISQAEYGDDIILLLETIANLKVLQSLNKVSDQLIILWLRQLKNMCRDSPRMTLIKLHGNLMSTNLLFY